MTVTSCTTDPTGTRTTNRIACATLAGSCRVVHLWPWTGAYVSHQGYAMPCCMVSTPDRVNFGNMAKQGVEAIWNGEPFEEFRPRLASDEPPDICRSCSLYHGTF